MQACACACVYVCGCVCTCACVRGNLVACVHMHASATTEKISVALVPGWPAQIVKCQQFKLQRSWQWHLCVMKIKPSNHVAFKAAFFASHSHRKSNSCCAHKAWIWRDAMAAKTSTSQKRTVSLHPDCAMSRRLPRRCRQRRIASMPHLQIKWVNTMTSRTHSVKPREDTCDGMHTSRRCLATV